MTNLLTSTLDPAPVAVHPSRRWLLDPSDATVRFEIGKLGGTARGSFGSFGGWIDWKPGTPGPLVTVHAHVDVASIDTKVRRRDEHLRSPDFFDAGRFPLATFDSTSFEPGEGSRGRLLGNLTIRDRTLPFRLDTDIEMDGDALRFSARGSFDRFDFGVSWGPRGVLVSRRATVLIEGCAASPAHPER